MQIRTTSIFLVLMLAGAPACKLVPLDEGAGRVRVLTPSEVSDCERLGKARVKVMAKVAGVERNPQKLSDELDILARNSALDMKGNVAVQDGEITDGGRSYLIYRCPEP